MLFCFTFHVFLCLPEVLRPYLPSSPRCLELFARNLWPGWTSWGREVSSSMVTVTLVSLIQEMTNDRKMSGKTQVSQQLVTQMISDRT